MALSIANSASSTTARTSARTFSMKRTPVSVLNRWTATSGKLPWRDVNSSHYGDGSRGVALTHRRRSAWRHNRGFD